VYEKRDPYGFLSSFPIGNHLRPSIGESLIQTIITRSAFRAFGPLPLDFTFCAFQHDIYQITMYAMQFGVFESFLRRLSRYFTRSHDNNNAKVASSLFNVIPNDFLEALAIQGQ
jgi:hypothetical protein